MSEIIVKMKDYLKIKGATYVRDLVRCKECKKWKTALCPFGDSLLDYNKEDGYCNYGEEA